LFYTYFSEKKNLSFIYIHIARQTWIRCLNQKKIISSRTSLCRYYHPDYGITCIKINKQKWGPRKIESKNKHECVDCLTLASFFPFFSSGLVWPLFTLLTLWAGPRTGNRKYFISWITSKATGPEKRKRTDAKAAKGRKYHERNTMAMGVERKW